MSITLSQFNDMWSTDAIELIFNNFSELSSVLNIMSNIQVPTKDSVALVSPGKFTGLKRLHSNVTSADIVMIDIDDGIPYEMLLPYIKEYEHIAYSTFSHDPENMKNRYRVILRIERTVTAYEHERVVKHLTSKLARNGVQAPAGRRGGAFGGVDTGKKHPGSMFYLPCNREGSKSGFFNHHDGMAFPINDSTIGESPAEKIRKHLLEVEIKHAEEEITESGLELLNLLSENMEMTRSHDDRFRFTLSMKACGFTVEQVIMVLQSKTPFDASDRSNNWAKIRTTYKQNPKTMNHNGYLKYLAKGGKHNV